MDDRSEKISNHEDIITQEPPSKKYVLCLISNDGFLLIITPIQTFLQESLNWGNILPMPITTSAKKALRGSQRKKIFNLRRKSDIVSLTKQMKKFILEKKTEEALALLPKFQKAIDKAVKSRVLKKNTASRKKSRTVSAIKRIS